MIKAVFFDCDGTLLSHNSGVVPASAKQALEDLRKQARESVLGTVKVQMDVVMKEFREEFRTEREQCEVSISAGIYITPVKAVVEDFESIYKKADYALYTSKRAGKARYTIYVDGPEEGDAYERE